MYNLKVYESPAFHCIFWEMISLLIGFLYKPEKNSAALQSGQPPPISSSSRGCRNLAQLNCCLGPTTSKLPRSKLFLLNCFGPFPLTLHLVRALFHLFFFLGESSSCLFVILPSYFAMFQFDTNSSLSLLSAQSLW